MMQNIAVITKYFPSLTVEQHEKLMQMHALYSEWNEKINVISRKDMDNFYERHVLHSLSISKVISFLPGARILDVGTGGGFPGIPLAILFPEAFFLLTDSIGKKIKVVQEVSKTLGLQNVEALQIRSENVSEKFDFIVSRAVAPLPDLVRWSVKKTFSTSKHSLPNGLLCLKGGDQLLEEISPVSVRYPVKTWRVQEYFPEPFFESKKVVYVKL